MGDEHLEQRPPVELYDLQEDPWEMENLAGRSERADVESDLASQLQDFLEETDDPILHGAVPRPQDEAEILDRIWSSIKK